MSLSNREWQDNALGTFLVVKKGIVVAPPATGKTHVAIRAIELVRAFAPTLIIVPTLDLANQWQRELLEQGIVPSRYDGETKELGDVTISTYASVCQIDESDLFWQRFKFIVMDEVHHLGAAPAYQRILVPVYKVEFALGLTATPPTDPKSLLLQVLPIIYKYTMPEARAAGYVAPIELVPIPVELTPEERTAYDNFTFQIGLGFKAVGAGGDLRALLASDHPKAIRAKYAITKRREITIGAFAKYEALLKLLEDLRDKDRILIFSERIEVLETCQALFEGTFTSAIISGETPREVRENIFQRWGHEFQILLTARVAEEGVNVVEVDTGIILAGTATTRQNLQRVGRLLRIIPTNPYKVAKLYILFARNTIEDKVVNTIREVTNEMS